MIRLWEMVSVQFSSVAQSCPTLCDPMNRSTPGLPVITNSRSSPKLTSIESVMPSSHLILCRLLLLLPPIPPSIRVFSNESTLSMRWPKYWSFSFSIVPWTPGVGDGQGGLVCCDSWGRKESDATDLIWSDLKRFLGHFPVVQWYRIHLQCRGCKRRGFDPWVRKIPWRRKWQSTLVFLPGESHGQRSLLTCNPWDHTESDTTEAT